MPLAVMEAFPTPCRHEQKRIIHTYETAVRITRELAAQIFHLKHYVGGKTEYEILGRTCSVFRRCVVNLRNINHGCEASIRQVQFTKIKDNVINDNVRKIL